MKLITDDGQEFKIEEVRAAELSENDVIVLELQGVVSQSLHARITEQMARIFGESRKVIILEEGAELSILRAPIFEVKTNADS